MISDQTHLTEDERQQAADGTLAEEQRATVDAHLVTCAECAADVDRIATLMTRIRETPTPEASIDGLWPSIRARIEQSKVVPLAAPTPAPSASTRRRAWWFGGLGIVAAALVIAIVTLRGRRVSEEPQTVAATGDTSASLVAVVDSAHAYEREAQILLDKLELQRALLRPDAVKALEHDLRVVDVAIAELKDAVARDPANPALRRLLAASYRQKVDLLKRASNAS